MKLLKIEFAFQPRSKSGVQSEVQSEVQKVVQIYGWGGTFKHVIKIQQVRDFFTIFGHKKDKNITLYDTNWFRNVAVVVDIVVSIVVVVALVVVVGVRIDVLLLLQQLLQYRQSAVYHFEINLCQICGIFVFIVSKY